MLKTHFLSFYLSENVFILSLFWRIVVLDIRFLINLLPPFWCSQLLVLLGFPCMWRQIFLAALKILYVFLAFKIFTLICLGINLFVFIIFTVCWASWMCWLMLFNNLGRCAAIIYLAILLVLSLSLLLILLLLVHWCA